MPVLFAEALALGAIQSRKSGQNIHLREEGGGWNQKFTLKNISNLLIHTLPVRGMVK